MSETAVAATRVSPLPRLGSVAAGLLPFLPGGLILYLAFHSGGYFPGATSFAALVLSLVFLVRIVGADAPFAGYSVPLAVAAGALMLFGAWTLLSASWSDSSARALLEFNRVLLYLLAVLLFGSVPRTAQGVRRMVWGVAAAITIVCVAGFLTRTMPDVFQIAPAAQKERLGYPIGYWNALGLLAALGITLCAGLTCSTQEPRVVRVAAAASLPVISSTLLFTFSRGPLAAAAVGLLAYFMLGRSRGLISGLIATGPSTAIALVAAYNADLLASKEPTTTAATAQGHDVALVVALCSAAAALARLLLLWLDARLAAMRVGAPAKRLMGAGAAAFVLVAAVVLLTGTDATDRVEEQYKRFTGSAAGQRFTGSAVLQTGDNRDRLTNPGINRLDIWQTSLDGFDASPARGQGAGTFALLWERQRDGDSDSEEGHSLYLEVLGELGLVGLILLALALAALLAGVALRLRRPWRSLYAAVFATALAWGLHAGIDWDWELPVLTLVVVCLAAAAAAAPPQRARVRRPSAPLRVVAGAGCVALAVTPALTAVSQARLAEGIRAYSVGDCRTAVDKVVASLDVLGGRPEPYEVAGYCYVRSNRAREGIDAMKQAVERDPDNWRYHYGLAVARAAAGRDPRAAAQAALRRNPKEPRAKEAVSRMKDGGPSAWRRAARELGPALR